MFCFNYADRIFTIDDFENNILKLDDQLIVTLNKIELHLGQYGNTMMLNLKVVL